MDPGDTKSKIILFHEVYFESKVYIESTPEAWNVFMFGYVALDSGG